MLKNVKYIIIILSVFLISSCSSRYRVRNQVVLLTDTIQNPYVYLNEIKINSKNSANILKKIQKLSENNMIKISNPEKRLAFKKKILKKCYNSSHIKECEYVPEKYKILSKKNEILCIEYSYNSIGSYDEWYKYACFNLNLREHLTYNKIFSNPNEVLKKYNKRYVQRINKYIKNNKQLTEEDKEEYEIYKSHLNLRTPFKLIDLNNIELIYNNQNKLEFIRFHYNGQGGVYRQLFPNDYIDFSINELKPFLKKSFNKLFYY